MRTTGLVSVLVAVLAAGLGLSLIASAASAVPLAALLDEVDGGGAQRPPCLAGQIDPKPSAMIPHGDCAADTLAQLYLGLLRDRALVDLHRDMVEYHRRVLESQQQRLAGGGGSQGDVLLAEVELKRWQLHEAQLARDIRQAELFFASVMASDPAGFQLPEPAASAWPADEAAALAVLAARSTGTPKERQASAAALQLAWAELEALRREVVLLEPMLAFARDLLVGSEQAYEVAQVTLSSVLKRVSDLFAFEDALLSAKYREVALQVRILELLGRRDALE